jgi:hypothetical protein
VYNKKEKMAQTQIYLFEIRNIMNLIGILNERMQTLDDIVHEFEEALQTMQDQVPPIFQITYRPEVDDGRITVSKK